MMLPASTCSPPNFFTPRRLLSESRPFRDEPPAFLCAMTNYFSSVGLAAGAFLDFLAGAASEVDTSVVASVPASAGATPSLLTASSGAGLAAALDLRGALAGAAGAASSVPAVAVAAE